MRIEMITAKVEKFPSILFSNETSLVAVSNEPTEQQYNENVEDVDESCAVAETSSESAVGSSMDITEITSEPITEETNESIEPKETGNNVEHQVAEPVAESSDSIVQQNAENTESSVTSCTSRDPVADSNMIGTESTIETEDTETVNPDMFEEIPVADNSTITVAKSEDVAFEIAEVSLSSIYRDDKYEEEYGDWDLDRFQKKSFSKKKSTSSAANSEKKKKPATAKTSESSTIHNHFESNGFVVIEYSKLPEIEGLKVLTSQIGDNYKFTAQFLKAARQAVCSPNAKGERVMRFTINNEAGGFFHTFMGTLKKYGLLTKYFINGNFVTATISPVPKVLSYLTGQWLEVYASQVMETTVKEYAQQHNVDYDIFMNVKVANIASLNKYAHEIDCVISIADKCFAFEAKSGTFDDYATLYNTRKELRFVPDHYLLLSTTIEDLELSKTLQYFYEFYITGIETFRDRLLEMINKAFA